MKINQYDIVLVNLDPSQGSEIKKTRPCLVISPNEINFNLSTITIAPMNTKSRPWPTRLKIRFNNTTRWVAMDQIRTIDKKRVIKILGKISSDEIHECKRIIKATFVD
jgi:mRNA interferase MazF